MNGRLTRISLIIAGWLCVLVGCLLLALSSLKLSSNHAERDYIRNHLSYSTPGAFEWSGWQPNDGRVTHFGFPEPAHEKRQKLAITEYRRGRAHGVLFDFIAYEGRATGVDAGAGGAFPALGPDWGAHYNSIWAISACVLGIVLIFVSRYFKPRGNGDLAP